MKFLVVLLIAMIPIQWETSIENAKKIAKEKDQLILLNFSGSDWCGPCIMMRKDFLENEAFTQFANEHLVLVNADFPRKKKNQPAPEIVKSNEALAEQYNKNGIFPFTVLLDSNGKVLRTWSGKPEVSVDEWLKEIKSVCNANK